MKNVYHFRAAAALSALLLPASLVAQCLPQPQKGEYVLSPRSSYDSPREAFEKAEKCLAALAARFSEMGSEIPTVAQAVEGGCQAEINHASARTQMAMTAAGVTAPPPDGFFIDLPPCTNGTEACEPWERKWTQDAEPLPPGSVIKSSNENAVRDAAVSAAARIRQDLGRRAMFWVMEARACAASMK